MAEKNIIIHIGAPKTATTLIQNCLKKSSIDLADSGIFVCDFLGPTNHKVLAYTFLNNNKNDKIQKNLKLDTVESRSKSEFKLKECFLDLLKTSSCKKLLVSSEDLQSKLDEDAIKKLSIFFQQMDVKVSVVLYIREQAAALNSHYSTVIKSSVSGFRLYPELPSKKQFLESRYNYLKSAMQWREYFPEDFKLLIYDKRDYYGESILSDFCYHTQIPFDIISNAYDSVKKSSHTRNKSLTDSHIKLLILFNSEHRNNYDNNTSEKILKKIKALELKSKSYVMPKWLWDEMRSLSNESNEDLRKVFFPQRPALFDYSGESLDYCSWASNSLDRIDFTEERNILQKLLLQFK